MLTLATLGMAAYGAYAAVAALIDLVGRQSLEIWANLASGLLGVILLIAGAFVRVMMPGGLALATGALLGLQAIALHDAAHLYQRIEPLPQIARGLFAAALVLLAWVGSRQRQPGNP